MGRWGARALAGLGAVVGMALFGGSGCSGNKATELVPGVMTQVVVPRDLHSIEIGVFANGRNVFCQSYDVTNGTATLPATLGLVSATSPTTVVTLEIRGYDTPGAMGTNIGTCLANVNGGDGGAGGAPRMLRRSVQSFVAGHILYLPMPLSYSCYDVDCSSSDNSKTCKGAQCVPAATDPKSLVDFTPALLDGTDVCFSAADCMPAMGTVSAVPIVLDAVNMQGRCPGGPGQPCCIYGFPYTPSSASSPGVNVRVYFEDVTVNKNANTQALAPTTTGGEAEILDLDPDEGFNLVTPTQAGVGASDAGLGDAGQTIPAPTQLFQLAPGLCKLALVAGNTPIPTGDSTSYRMINRIEVANTCKPKVQLLPICKEDLVPVGSSVLPGGTQSTAVTADGTCQISAPLIPAPSAIYLAMDQSAKMHGAYGDKGSATALSLSFNDPVFKRTYAGFQFLPGLPRECPPQPATSFINPVVPFGLPGVAQQAIAMQLQKWQPSEGSVGNGMCMFSSTCGGGTCTATNGMNGQCIPAGLLNQIDLEAALRTDDQGVYGALRSYLQGKEAPAIAAAMFFLNRTPDNSTVATGGNDCPTTSTTSTAMQAIESDIMAAFNGTPSIQTYFVVLDDDEHDTHSSPNGAYTFFQKVQADLPNAVATLDGSQDAQTVLTNFSNIVTKLGTCLYELPKGLTDSSQATVKFAPPGVPVGSETTVPANANCNEGTQATQDGWNVDTATGRLRICGNPCTQLRNTILAYTASAVANNLTPPDITVTASLMCGLPAGGGSGGTGGGTMARDSGSGMMVVVDSGSAGDSTTGAGDSSGIVITGDASEVDAANGSGDDSSGGVGTGDATVDTGTATPDGAVTVVDAGVGQGG